MRHLEGQLEEKNQELQRVCMLRTTPLNKLRDLSYIKEGNVFLDYGLYLKSYGYALCILKKKILSPFNQHRHKIKYDFKT